MLTQIRIYGGSRLHLLAVRMADEIVILASTYSILGIAGMKKDFAHHGHAPSRATTIGDELPQGVVFLRHLLLNKLESYVVRIRHVKLPAVSPPPAWPQRVIQVPDG
jgi:hypothetical protein